MSQPTIVQADLSLVELAADLFDAYRQFYGQPADRDAARRFLADRLTAGESVVLLAVQGEPPVGLGFAQVYPSFSSVRLKPLWILNDLFVAPQARRRGIGRLLLDAVADRARAAGACRVVLATAIDNVAAQALYESVGYEKDKEFLHYERPLAPAATATA